MKNIFLACALLFSANVLGQMIDQAKITIDLSKTQEKMKPIYACLAMMSRIIPT
jgi:flavorubredoxin